MVDFRTRHALSDVEQPDAVPLIYPGNLRAGGVLWPRAIHKPQWFQPHNDKDRGMLLPEGWYTVVKRFSAKEERRRIVASVWSPVDNPGQVAFENHLNVFHISGHGLDEDLAKGIAVWLNSSVIDKLFRTFSGHTQVNATDLRTLRFPAAAALRELGRKTVASQVEIDLFGFIYFIVVEFRLFAFGRIMDMGSRSRSFFSSRLRRGNIFVVLVLCCIIVVIGKVGYFVCVVLCPSKIGRASCRERV